jgi:hypothetical protein
MNEAVKHAATDVCVAGRDDLEHQIASLRQAGAHRYDPVRLRAIEALAQRIDRQPLRVQQILRSRLAQSISAFQARFDQASGAARGMAAQAPKRYPNAATELQLLVDAGDFQGLTRRVATLERQHDGAGLAALARHMAQHAQESPDPSQLGGHSTRPELKSIRYFRNTWSKLSAEKQVTQALQQAPKNAGPINSHMLVLRSLALMREISPDYLNRFMSYADTLLRLDPGTQEKKTDSGGRHPKRNGVTDQRERGLLRQRGRAK